MTTNPLSTIPPIGPATGMTPRPSATRFKPIDPVRLLRKHYKLLFFSALIGLMVGVGLYWGLREKRPQFTSKATLVVDTRTISNAYDTLTSATALGVGSDDSAIAYMNNETNYIVSEEIIRDALLRPKARDTAWYRSMPSADTAKATMQEEMLKAGVVRGSTLIQISMVAPNPGDARVLLQELMDTYLTRKKLIYDQAGSSLRRLFLSEESRSGNDVRDIQRRMDRFIQDNDITSLSANASEEQVVYNRLLQQSLDANLFLERAVSRYESLQESTSSQAMTDAENAYLKSLPKVLRREEELRALAESRRELMAGGTLNEHPQIKSLDRRRDTVEIELGRIRAKELGEYRSLQIQGAASAVEGLTSQLTSLQPQLEETSNRMRDLTQKLNEFKRLEEELTIAREKQHRADTALDTLRTLSGRDDYVRVRKQSDPSDPVLTFPSPVLIFLCTFALTGLVGGLVVLREMLDQRVRSPQDLKLLPDTNLLGQVPHSGEDPTGASVAERTVELAPTGLLAESYRQIRTAVLSKMDRRGYKTLVCVSAQPEAGTSTVVQNLAASLAFNGRNVLVIDANFRRPSQHIFMEGRNAVGLIDVLKNKSAAEDAILEHPDTSLAVLPTGRAIDSPPELLEGAAFRSLLGQLETRYDMILIDAPPALLTSDSQLLSKHVDAIAVVVQADIDKWGMLARMLSRVDGQRADVLGVVLNGVKSAAGGYFRKSYEDFYRYRDTGGLSGQKFSASRDKEKAKGRGRKASRGKKRLSPDAHAADRSSVEAGAGESAYEIELED